MQTIYGTSAYKYEPRTAVQPVRQVKKGISKRAHRKRAFANVSGVLIITFLAFILLARYAMITEMSATVSRLAEEYESLSSAVVQKEFKLEQDVDLKKIEDIAVNQLGMQRPEKYQIVYIDLQNSDYTEGAPEESKSGFFAFLSGGFTQLVEYFN